MIVLVDTPYEAICYPAAKLFAETIFRSRQIYYRFIRRIIRRSIHRIIRRIIRGDNSFLVDFHYTVHDCYVCCGVGSGEIGHVALMEAVKVKAEAPHGLSPLHPFLIEIRHLTNFSMKEKSVR